MKKYTGMIVITMFLVTANAFAAEIMTRENFDKVKGDYEKIGTVSTSGETSIADARQELTEKAEKKGADVLVLTSGNTNNKVHGTADLYKKKQ